MREVKISSFWPLRFPDSLFLIIFSSKHFKLLPDIRFSYHLLALVLQHKQGSAHVYDRHTSGGGSSSERNESDVRVSSLEEKRRERSEVRSRLYLQQLLQLQSLVSSSLVHTSFVFSPYSNSSLTHCPKTCNTVYEKTHSSQSDSLFEHVSP